MGKKNYQSISVRPSLKEGSRFTVRQLEAAALVRRQIDQLAALQPQVKDGKILSFKSTFPVDEQFLQAMEERVAYATR